MAEAKHTPGPWTIEPIAHYQGSKSLVGANIVGRNNGTMVAEIRGAIEIGGLRHDENLANARLIAAAPDLLEAAKMALENIQGIADGDDIPSLVIRDRLRAAIAKAGAA